MHLKSINLWLDNDGFHGMKYGMTKPDMAKDMCVKHDKLPKGAWLFMSPEDKKRVGNFLNKDRKG